MLLKSADDKSRRVSLLEDLQKSPLLDARQKLWLRQELGRLRKGIEGERDSAYYLDHYFKGGENHVLLHDLRFEFEGDVAQIDHLIINRLGFMFLIETKNYGGSVSVNAHGEFTVDYDGDRFGVPSPIEQSKRHERVLRRLFERLEISNRKGMIEAHHVVMYHPKAIIARPKQAEFDTSNVIKSDQFPSWHEKFANGIGVGTLVHAIANMRSIETISDWGARLLRQHRPANLLALPDFMQPKSPPPLPPPPPPAAVNKPHAPTSPHADVIAPAALKPSQKKLVCLQCHSKISFAEGKFCWNDVARFKGGQYCRQHQAAF